MFKFKDTLPKAFFLIIFFVFIKDTYATDIPLAQSTLDQIATNDAHDFWIIVIIFSFALIAMVLKQRSRSRRDQVRLETIRILAEKNQPIPPELLAQDPFSRLSGVITSRRAIGMISAGVGLMVYFLAVEPGKGLWAIGLILICMGTGHLWLNKNPQK